MSAFTYTIEAGHGAVDISGGSNTTLQAAVDHVAAMGGGVVRVLPGQYAMRDSLHLRNGVEVRGVGDVVLEGLFGPSSALAADGDYGEEKVTVVDATGWAAGMGIAVADANAGGFHTTVATVMATDGDVLYLNKPLLADCMVARGAVAWNTFPVVSGYYVEGARLTNITVVCTPEAKELNGCRGAGIFLYRCHGAVIEDCAVTGYPGDGLSFQQSDGVVVRRCTFEKNRVFGLHPGSGSGRPQVERCTSRYNGEAGLFVCWRVKEGRFEANSFDDNSKFGISIGHKDTDNVFSGNSISRNGRWGILARRESEAMGAHRNTFAGNIIAENGTRSGGAVYINGVTKGWKFSDNKFVRATLNASELSVAAIELGPGAEEPELVDNEFDGYVEPYARRVDG